MPVIDHLFSIGRIRKAIWQLWYPFLTRRLHGEGVLFLNYAYEEDPPLGIKLSPDDEGNRACIQLYHHVAAQVELRREVGAWEEERNELGVGVQWRFTTADARIKLRRLYPSTQT